MPKVLERWLSGWNAVIDGPDDVARHAGVTDFESFANGLELSLPILSHALKIPLKDLEELRASGGYISGDAQNNIFAFVEAKNALEQYLECQYGPRQ